jgi:hypothetical protein
MANSKESFEILENGSGDGVSPTSSLAGDASSGKIGMTVFAFKDSSGNLLLPSLANTLPGLADQALPVRVLPYEPKSYSAFVENVIIGNNKSMLAIQNTSANLVKIQSIKIVNSRTAAVAGIVSDFRLLRITSFTGGTSVTAGLYDTADVVPAGITLATNSTVSGEVSTVYNRWLWSSDEWGAGALDTEAAQVGQQQGYPAWVNRINSKPIVLRQNQGIHIKHVINSVNGQFDFLIEFTVE